MTYLKEHQLDASDDLLTQFATEIQENYKGEDKDAYFQILHINNRTIKRGKLFNKKYNIKRENPKLSKPSKEDEQMSTIMTIFSSLDSGILN